MRRKNRKYIVYVNADYMAKIFVEDNAYSHAEQNKIRKLIYKQVSQFIRGKEDGIIFFDQFRDASGKISNSVDIVPLPKCSMRDIRHQSQNKRII